jgi:uncharacterized protein (DUF924 family)
MSEKVVEERPIKFLGFLLPSLPRIIFRCAGTFLRFKRDANKAGKVFKKELIEQGIDKQTATELTDIYTEGSDLFKLIKNIT